MRQTHTFVELDLSPEAFEEIRSKLFAAGYHHCFNEGYATEPLRVNLRLDMQGIALKSEAWQADPEKYTKPKCAPHGQVNCPGCTHPRGD
jgi:hypothetical protein